MKTCRNETLLFRNETLLFRNEILLFWNEILLFSNEILLVRNEILHARDEILSSPLVLINPKFRHHIKICKVVQAQNLNFIVFQKIKI